MYYITLDYLIVVFSITNTHTSLYQGAGGRQGCLKEWEGWGVCHFLEEDLKPGQGIK